jgi:nitroimidazol reductase NimA-like FMN-containing flavoprotein (pyridoxamine 5'-phosphate oxidase superfamily)
MDPERPNIVELTEDRCWELLARKKIGRLAVSITNHPDIFPVNYRVRDQTIVIRTAEGQKLAAAILGTAVAFEVDALDEDTETGWSIVVKGTADEPKKLEDYLRAEDLEIETWASGEKSRFIIITPSWVSGREIPLD